MLLFVTKHHLGGWFATDKEYHTMIVLFIVTLLQGRLGKCGNLAAIFLWLLPYSRKFSLVHENASRLFRKKFCSFYFHGMNALCSDHSPTSWWPCPTYEPKKRHWTTKWRSKLVQQQCNLPLCGDLRSQLRKYQDCHRVRVTGLFEKDQYWLISTATTSELLLRVCWQFV